MWCVSKWAPHALLWCCYKSLSRTERRVRGISSHTVAFIMSFIINAKKQNTKFYLYNMSLSLCCDIWRKFKLRLSITEEKGQWGCFSTSSDGSAQLSTMTKTIRMMRKRHEKTNCGKWGWVAQRLSRSRFWYESSTPTSQELSSPIFQSESVCLFLISNTWPDPNFFQYIKAYMPSTYSIPPRINQ